MEARAWLGLIVSVSGLEYALDRELQSTVGISHSTYGILAALSSAPNEERHLSELAGVVGHSQSRLSHAISRLEKDGLLRRSDCEADKRAKHVSLTDTGRKLMARAAPGHVNAVRRLVFDRLTREQVEVLAEVGASIHQGLVDDGLLPHIDELDTNTQQRPRR